MGKLKASSPVRELAGRRDALNLAKKTARARSPTGDSPRRSSPPEQGWGYLRPLFQESPEGICLIDASMRVMVWNRAATEITGCGASDVLGRLCYLKGNTLELERFCRAECPIAQEGGSPLVCDFCIKGWQPFSTMAIPVRHEDVAFLILVLRQVPFPLQLLTRLDALLTRYAAPQEPRGPPAPPGPHLPRARDPAAARRREDRQADRHGVGGVPPDRPDPQPEPPL